MQRERLTSGRIRQFSCPQGTKQAFLWDTEAPRLAVRATSGSKSYIFESKLNRQTLRVTIGDPKAWTIEAARAEARRLQTLVDQGIDPRQEKADRLAAVDTKKEEARRAEVTVGEAWEAYLEARKPKWGARHLRNHMNMAKAGGEKRTRGRRKGESELTQPGPLFPLLSMRMVELDADAVHAWLEPMAARTPTQGAQTYRALRAFLAWCSDRPEYSVQTHEDACTARKVREVLPQAKAKDDCLQREQLALWFEHVGKLRNPVHAAYLQALLLTGARREELAGLKWADVDFQWKGLTIRDKVEGERTIPLTPYVAALLAPLPRRNEWVFSSPTAASGRLQEPRIGHVKALNAAGLPALSLHGLRRSFGTLAEWVECPAGISAQIMGHKPSAIAEKHYRRRPLDLLRQWHTKIEGWILEQAGIEQPQEGERGLKVVA